MNKAQQEILYKLIEEAAEFIQACSKALNHGLDSCEPGTSAPSNAEKIENELGELIFYFTLADKYGVIKRENVQASCERKRDRPNNYYHHIPED